jgi:hypothetical protein
LFIYGYSRLLPLIRSFRVFSAGIAELKIDASRAIRGISKGLPVVPYVHVRRPSWVMGVGPALSFQIRVSTTPLMPFIASDP